MPENQQFLKELDSKLWTAANKLRANLDAAVYKHAVPGLIFLKYVSDSSDIRQQQVEAQLCDKNHDYFLDPAEYDGDNEYKETIRQESEVRDYYVEENVFWVPVLARWKTIQENAEGKKGGQYYTPKSIVNLIVEILKPFKGRVYDPAKFGERQGASRRFSFGFFVSSEGALS